MISEIFLGLVIAGIIILIIRHKEGFKNREEKISALTDWWSDTSTLATYREYKKAIPQPDVIEYKKIKDLIEAGYDIEKAVRVGLE